MANRKLATVDELRRTDPAAVEMRRVLAADGRPMVEQAEAYGVSARTLRRYRRGQGLQALRVYLRALEGMAEKRRAA